LSRRGARWRLRIGRGSKHVSLWCVGTNLVAKRAVDLFAGAKTELSSKPATLGAVGGTSAVGWWVDEREDEDAAALEA